MTGRRPEATCAPAHRADPGWRTRRRNRPPQHAPARSKPPANTEHACQQRLFGVIEQVVGPLHRVAQRLVTLQSAPRPHQQPESVVEPVPQSRVRSSTACVRRPTRSPAESRRGGGRSRRQRSASSACQRNARCDTVCARSMNNDAAAESSPGRASSDGTGQSCSSATRNPSRLVARIFTVDEAAKIDLDHVGAASRTCSQLSNTSSRDRPSNAAATLSASAHTRLLGDTE